MADENLPKSTTVQELAQRAGADVRLLPVGLNDRDRAIAIRAQAEQLLQPIIALMTEANKDGFHFGFNLALDASGRGYLSNLNVVKTF